MEIDPPQYLQSKTIFVDLAGTPCIPIRIDTALLILTGLRGNGGPSPKARAAWDKTRANDLPRGKMCSIPTLAQSVIRTMMKYVHSALMFVWQRRRVTQGFKSQDRLLVVDRIEDVTALRRNG